MNCQWCGKEAGDHAECDTCFEKRYHIQSDPKQQKALVDELLRITTNIHNSLELAKKGVMPARFCE